MSSDLLKIVFVFFLIVTAVLFFLRKGPVLSLGEIGHILLDFLLVPAVLITVVTFLLILTDTDPMRLILEGSARLTGNVNVSFVEAVPERLENSLSVLSVSRHDTDGDNFNEWVVFYEFDKTDNHSPVMGAIYDSDRGNPPVIFPYQLRAPDRDHLSEGNVSLSFAQIPPADSDSAQEILVDGSSELSIFRFTPNPDDKEWMPPADFPPRYQTIGFFRGTDGVTFGDDQRVTTFNRGELSRSQLGVRSVYEYDTNNNSYYQVNTTQLLPPVVETIDFLSPGPPADILNSSFPEKVVLGFYTATCGSVDDSLCIHTDATDDWNAVDFLAPDDEPKKESALREFQRGNATYFGLSSLTNGRNVLIKRLRYYPQIEQASAQPKYTGAQPQGNCVEVQLGNSLAGEPDILAYGVRLVDGQWKMVRRLELELCRTVAEFVDSGAASFSPPPAATPDSGALPPLGAPSDQTPGLVPTQVPAESQ